jgi:tetratricopeptide (TPR) repeat protein
MNVQAAITDAINHQQAGQFEQAESIYRLILSEHPNQPDALRFMGIVAYQTGRVDQAIDLLRQSIALNPDSAECHENLGQVLAGAGRLEESVNAFRQSVALNPTAADSYNNLGTVLLSMGRLDQAIDVYRLALTIQSDAPDTLSNLGIALTRQGKSEQALPYLQQAITLRQNFPEAHCNLGIAYRAQKRLDDAIASFKAALTLRPDYSDASLNLADTLREAGRLEEALACARQITRLHGNFPQVLDAVGVVLQACKRFDQAIDVYKRAIELNPNFAEVHYNLGTCLRDAADDVAAIQEFRKALELRPDLTPAHNNLASTLMDLGKNDQAMAALRSALAIAPDLATAHFNLGVILLTQGDLPRGFEELEWRWRAPELGLSNRKFPQPRWNGEELNGRTILIHAEQGFGDTLQFIRYLPMVAQRGGRIILACQKELARLFRQFEQVEQLVSEGEPLPQFDVHCALLTLPMVFKTDLQSIPNQSPYLRADANLSSQWMERLPGAIAERKIGLTWSGRANYERERARSIELSTLASLANVAGVHFVSLQTGDAAKHSTKFPGLLDFSDQLNDFADTAALIDNLDLVITIDTATAHLAGAMGKPVWAMLPHVPDWRWMLDRGDSPWYPSMKLFRQPRAGDWKPVVTDIVKMLESV